MDFWQGRYSEEMCLNILLIYEPCCGLWCYHATYKACTILHSQCELYHWADVLDICDEVLDRACRKKDAQWILPCDLPENAKVRFQAILQHDEICSFKYWIYTLWILRFCFGYRSK